MPNELTRMQIQESYQELSHKISAVMGSNYSTAETFFNSFMKFCETDQVLLTITSPLKEVNVPFDDWWNRSYPNGSRKFELPDDPLKQYAFLYQLSLKIYSRELSYNGVCFDYFRSDHLNDNIHQFNQNVIQTLNNYFHQKLNRLITSIPVDNKQVYPPIIHVSGDNSRVNINSVDRSTNIVSIEMNQFDDIENIILQIQDEGERTVCLNSFNELKESVGTGSYIQKYQQFIATAADHITLAAPLATFLAGLLSS